MSDLLDKQSRCTVCWTLPPSRPLIFLSSSRRPLLQVMAIATTKTTTNYAVSFATLFRDTRLAPGR